MADFYLKSGSAVERANDAAKVLGDKIVILRGDTTANYLVVRKWIMECTTAGTTGAAVPAWPTAVAAGDTLVDGTVTWTFRKPGFSSGTTANWAFSAIFMDYVATALAAGDTLYVSHLHAESSAAALSITFPGTLASPNRVLCGNDAAAPPTALATTASVTTTGNFALSISGSLYMYGVNFHASSGGTSGITFTIAAGDTNYQIYDNCLLNNANTNTAGNAVIAFGIATSNVNSAVLLKNTNIEINGTGGAGITLQHCNVRIEGGAYALGASAVTFVKSSGELALLTAVGFDLSAIDAASNLVGNLGSNGSIKFINCKLPAAWTGNIGVPTDVGNTMALHNCDNADTNYKIWTSAYQGSIRDETTIVKTSGASDGTTALAWKMTTTADAEYPLLPLESGEIAYWNDTTAAAKTLTVDIIHDSLTALNDDEVWLEVQYLGTAGFPLGSFISDAKANVLSTAAAQTASTATWTTTGLTNPNKQKLSVTLTPQEKGYYFAKVKLAKPSYTIYVDPLVTVA